MTRDYYKKKLLLPMSVLPKLHFLSVESMPDFPFASLLSASENRDNSEAVRMTKYLIRNGPAIL